jgi:hypothetical protein
VRTPGPLGSTVPGDPSARSYEDFKKAVLERQIHGKVAEGKRYYPAVPDAALQVVEGRFRMRKEAAQSCRALLKAARLGLEQAKEAGESLALGADGIGIQSAYRDFSEDSAAWEKSFRQHYAKTMTERSHLAGGRHGNEALAVMVRRMRKFKAPPGFSNHSNGTAVDFNTTQDRKKLEALTEQKQNWRDSWLHAWLVKHAAQYDFKPLSTEEWHWDHEQAP